MANRLYPSLDEKRGSGQLTSILLPEYSLEFLNRLYGNAHGGSLFVRICGATRYDAALQRR